MSVQELKRIEVLARVKAGTLKVKDAAVLLGVCERQAKRLWRKYRRQGPAARRHKGAGRRSHRAKPKAWRRKVLNLYRRKSGGNAAEGEAPFGPTLAAEHMGDDDHTPADLETLRRWLLARHEPPVQRSAEGRAATTTGRAVCCVFTARGLDQR